MLLSSSLFRHVAVPALLLSASVASAERILQASSLFTCMENSLLSADHFDVTFTPDNATISYDVSITSEVQGYVYAEIDVYAYGIKIITETLNPCDPDINIGSLCPLVSGDIDIRSTYTLSQSVLDSIPGIAYTIPDIDITGIVRVKNSNSTLLACIQADLTNVKTVEHIAVKWVTAIISGIGLLTSAVVATLGSSLSSAHVAANAVSLFAYFQSVVIINMMAVDRVPPIASSWAQNLAWSVGLIKVEFMQKIFRWYVQATGGTPTLNIIYPTVSILVQKRDLAIDKIYKLTETSRDAVHALAKRFIDEPHLAKRTTLSDSAESTSTLLVLRGIKRVAYQAGIENTSVVLTAFTFFVLICLAICICFTIFYGIVLLLIRTKTISNERFLYFQANWRVMLKGTVLRILLIACPSLLIFSLWEFIQRDSAAVIVLAVFFLILTAGILGWSGWKVFLIGRESEQKHQTPALLLFSDTRVLNRYGFLYIAYKATSYAFLIPLFAYIFIKTCFVSFAQSSGKTQALAMFIIELAYLVGICVYKPYMDKSTNVINIIIAVIMLINAIFFLFFSQLFGQPRAVSSIMGLIFFILNAAFSLILLVYTLVTCTMALVSKNPDSRYKPAQDDRASFIRDSKHKASDAAELTALGAAMRANQDHSVENGFSVDHELLSGDNSISTNSLNEKRDPFSDEAIKTRNIDNDDNSSVLLEYPNNPTLVSSRPSSLSAAGGSQFEFTATNDMTTSNTGHTRSDSKQSILDTNAPVNAEQTASPKSSKWKLFEKKDKQ
ncbi:hypothetical protein D0Z00_001971 [Geotrichum galactomycetum]|uniref:Uncharacterized protein n=1 Tax=Geotrichum galactomycetum TaxID=27317 RepID=A0ACB6V5G3_9ASCO|nr:hypothetical protein D0Z00_001971 [Geotrichum candidum]